MSGPDLLAIDDYGRFREALRESGCDRCDLACSRTNIVVDRGNPEARILAVGEGPGAEEDATGRAFVGRGGRLLDELLLTAGLDTNRDLLIANVVKCRPPKNRVPRKEEARTCLPFLLHQIRLVAPQVVVLLGATALRHLLPHRARTTMREIVGRPFKDAALEGVECIVFYHPAFLLRDPRKLPVAREHAQTLKNLVGLGD